MVVIIITFIMADILQAVFYALQTDLGLHLNDLATMTLIQALSGCDAYTLNPKL